MASRPSHRFPINTDGTECQITKGNKETFPLKSGSSTFDKIGDLKNICRLTSIRSCHLALTFDSLTLESN